MAMLHANGGVLIMGLSFAVEVVTEVVHGIAKGFVIVMIAVMTAARATLDTTKHQAPTRAKYVKVELTSQVVAITIARTAQTISSRRHLLKPANLATTPSAQ